MAEQIWDNGVLRDATPEEEAVILERLRAEAKQRHRQLDAAEVLELMARQNVQALNVDDQTANHMRAYYPAWSVGTSYIPGERVVYGEALYRCLRACTAQVDQAPAHTPALWLAIREEYAGDPYDPIPYGEGLTLEPGKYYVQDGTAYCCTAPHQPPVPAPLSGLVGTYLALDTSDTP